MKFRFRYLVPNGISFISLACGILSLLFTIEDNLYLSGILILTSYLLDTMDGFTARRLNASSSFGLQLDSLVDMVSLGMAPSALVFGLLNDLGIDNVISWGLVVMIPIAGAFRLARFNLLPMKESSSNVSIGMTISTAGGNIALLVLAQISSLGVYIHPNYILPFLAVHAILMVSVIPFPSVTWAFAKKRLPWLLPLMALTIWDMTFIGAWFFWQLVYVVVVIVRYAIIKARG